MGYRCGGCDVHTPYDVPGHEGSDNMHLHGRAVEVMCFVCLRRHHCHHGERQRVLNLWYGMVWYGTVWYGMVWYGMVWYGTVWYGMVRYGMVWYGMVWYGMVWYGTVWYGMVRYAPP